MRKLQHALMAVVILGAVTWANAEAAGKLPVQVGEFPQQIHEAYTTAEGLPAGEILTLAVEPGGVLHAKSEESMLAFNGERWVPASGDAAADLFQALPWYPSLAPLVGSHEAVRDVAVRPGEIAVAAEGGLYIGDGTEWQLALPMQGEVRWAPVDVRAVAYDAEGYLWFAAPQGVGYRIAKDDWRLFTGKEGLPFNDFTCMAASTPASAPSLPQGVCAVKLAASFGSPCPSYVARAG